MGRFSKGREGEKWGREGEGRGGKGGRREEEGRRKQEGREGNGGENPLVLLPPEKFPSYAPALPVTPNYSQILWLKYTNRPRWESLQRFLRPRSRLRRGTPPPQTSSPSTPSASRSLRRRLRRLARLLELPQFFFNNLSTGLHFEVILTCISSIFSSGNKLVLLVLHAHFEVVVLSIAAVSVKIGQVNAQPLTHVIGKPVKVVVTSTQQHTVRPGPGTSAVWGARTKPPEITCQSFTVPDDTLFTRIRIFLFIWICGDSAAVYKVSSGTVNDWHVISGGFVRAPQTALVPRGRTIDLIDSFINT